MRILVLAEADVRATGSGAERVLAHHVHGLAARGHDVRVISGGSGASSEAGGIRIERIGWSMRTPGHARAAAERIGGRDVFDVVLAHHPLPALRLAASPALGRVPLVAVVLSSWAEEYAVRSRSAARARWSPAYRVRLLVERRVLRAAARVLAMSAFMASRVRALHGVSPDRIRIVPGAVDRARFSPRPPDLARKELGLPGDARLLLSLRNLEPRMGLDVLIDAMPRVVERHPDVALVIAGDGPMRAALEARAARRGLDGAVRFTGFVAEEQLADLYAAADLFVLPTQSLEGFGLVTVEALASGTPVIGTPVGATPGLLAPLDASLVTDGRSAEDLARGILRTLDRADLDVLRTRCRDYTVAYDSDVIAARLERELCAVVAETRR